MDFESVRLPRGILLNAKGASPATVTLPYEETLRVALLLGVYEGAWETNQVLDALHWWRALVTALPHEQGWVFTLRDFEPMWINEKSADDFAAVHVVADNEGHLCYEVTSRHAGYESTKCYANVNALAAAAASLAER
ncbi:hypothetical protein ACFU7T_25490 [Streptomyces sp. NPDC057555]|uniref:hypothetical protein n=1 Tax=Streptomyces sp. NPDC057555 TaxID=3346166 RepID=UPI0036D16A5C